MSVKITDTRIEAKDRSGECVPDGQYFSGEISGVAGHRIFVRIGEFLAPAINPSKRFHASGVFIRNYAPVDIEIIVSGGRV